MSTYAIGDIQGCYREFCALLERIQFSPQQDRLILLGDIVNRGPQSLEMLRWVYEHRDCVNIVLGNHDLHLIAVHAGISQTAAEDTLMPILQAADADQLVGWLRRQPLVHDPKIQHSSYWYICVHAGLWPSWSVANALAYSAEVSQQLSGDHYRDFLAQMYGKQPSCWHDYLTSWGRLRLIVNICTRMRCIVRPPTKEVRFYLDRKRARAPFLGYLDFTYKDTLEKIPKHLQAWFDVPPSAKMPIRAKTTVLCGHWSALGLLRRKTIIALDTGCVWGGQLSALRLEDKQLFTQPALTISATDALKDIVNG